MCISLRVCVCVFCLVLGCPAVLEGSEIWFALTLRYLYVDCTQSLLYCYYTLPLSLKSVNPEA